MTKTTKIVSMLALLGAVGAAQAAIPANLTFDGYCDGMTGLTKNGNGVAGTWSNLDCAGTNGLLGGSQGKGKGMLTKGYIMGSTGIAAFIGTEVTWVVNTDGTWVIYNGTDGSVLNTGTWTAALAGVRGTGGKPSVQK
jgi:hypothetical protein